MSRKNFQYSGLQPNATYAVQVRGLDEEGNPGRWSAALEFDTVKDDMPPEQVPDLNGEVDGSNFVITWTRVQKNEDGTDLDDLRDYLVTIEAAGEEIEHSTVDNVFVFTFTRNKNGFSSPQPAIEVTVQARDRVGNLSTPSTITLVKQPPANPILQAISKRNAVKLTWTEVEDDLDRYDIVKNDTLLASVGPGTIVFTDTDVGTGAQAYVVRAFDRFGQFGESNTEIESEVSVELEDRIAPKAPDNLQFDGSNFSSPGFVAAVFSWDAPTEDEDETSYTDQEGFRVRYRLDETRPWNYIDVEDDRALGTDEQTFSTEQELPQGVDVYWGVQAFDRNGNFSVWATAFSQTDEDDTKPPTPSVPVVAGNLQNIQIRHDLRDSDGNLLPVNVQRLDFHISKDENFVPDYPDQIEESTTLLERTSVNRLIRMNESIERRGDDPPLFNELVFSSPFEVEDEDQDVYVIAVAVTEFPSLSDPSETAGPEIIKLVENIHIQDATITDAKIANLSANKLVAGTAFVSDLDVESKLTVLDGGIIESEDFDFSQRTGWALDNNNLFLFDGEIDAKLIQTQQEANILDQGYTQFTYADDWYQVNIFHESPLVVFQTSSESRYGPTALRVVRGPGQFGGEERRVFFGTQDSSEQFNHNIRVEPGTDYISSIYVYNDDNNDVEIQLELLLDDDSFLSSDVFTVLPGQWERVQQLFTIPANIDLAMFVIKIVSDDADVIFDGAQLEIRSGLDDSASFFKTSGGTTISGNQITTGSIQSNNFIPPSETQLGQGWQITIDGQAVFQEAIITGDILGGTINIGGEDAFHVDNDGNMWIGAPELQDANFSVTNQGDLVALSGRFEGDIEGGTIQIGGSSGFRVDSSGNMWLGATTFSGAPFRVSNQGALRALSGTFQGNITGGTIDIGNNFSVDSNGNLEATNANVTGTVEATSLVANAEVQSPIITGGEITGTTIISGNPFGRNITIEGGNIRFFDSDGQVFGRLQSFGANNRSIILDALIGGIPNGDLELGGGNVILDALEGISARAFFIAEQGLEVQGDATILERTRAWGNQFALRNPSNTGQRGGLRAGEHSSGVELQVRRVNIFGTVQLSSGDYLQVAAANFRQQSTIEAKEDISDFNESALSLIEQTRVVKYKLKNQEAENNGHVGFIAEELPDLLSPSHDSYSVADLVAVSYKAIQELYDKIKKLESRMS